MIDLMSIRQSYERREIHEIRWISGDSNPADAMTKSKPCAALRDLIDTNRIKLDTDAWVERTGSGEELLAIGHHLLEVGRKLGIKGALIGDVLPVISIEVASTVSGKTSGCCSPKLFPGNLLFLRTVIRRPTADFLTNVTNSRAFRCSRPSRQAVLTKRLS